MMHVDLQIMDAINDIRAANHACTAGAVAHHLNLSKTWVVQRCEVLRAQGFVAWTPMSGSLRVTQPIAKTDSAPSVEQINDSGDDPIVLTVVDTLPGQGAERAGSDKKSSRRDKSSGTNSTSDTTPDDANA